MNYGTSRKRTSAQPFAPRRGARCADVCGFMGRPRIRAGLRRTNAASAHHAAQKNEGWHQASPRLTNRTKMFSPLYLDNFISATRITPQVGKRARRARRPRRSKLRIFRFRASTKAQSLRCFSSPHKAVRLCGVPKTGERETHRGQPWQAASCRPTCLDTQCPACT